LHFAVLLDLYKLAAERPPNKRTAIMISVIDKCLNDMVCDTTASTVLLGHTRMSAIDITNEIVICQMLDQVFQNDNPERGCAQRDEFPLLILLVKSLFVRRLVEG
jgi:hypothetical protein